MKDVILAFTFTLIVGVMVLNSSTTNRLPASRSNYIEVSEARESCIDLLNSLSPKAIIDEAEILAKLKRTLSFDLEKNSDEIVPVLRDFQNLNRDQINALVQQLVKLDEGELDKFLQIIIYLDEKPFHKIWDRIKINVSSKVKKVGERAFDTETNSLKMTLEERQYVLLNLKIEKSLVDHTNFLYKKTDSSRKILDLNKNGEFTDDELFFEEIFFEDALLEEFFEGDKGKWRIALYERLINKISSMEELTGFEKELIGYTIFYTVQGSVFNKRNIVYAFFYRLYINVRYGPIIHFFNKNFVASAIGGDFDDIYPIYMENRIRNLRLLKYFESNPSVKNINMKEVEEFKLETVLDYMGLMDSLGDKIGTYFGRRRNSGNILNENNTFRQKKLIVLLEKFFGDSDNTKLIKKKSESDNDFISKAIDINNKKFSKKDINEFIIDYFAIINGNPYPVFPGKFIFKKYRDRFVDEVMLRQFYTENLYEILKRKGLVQESESSFNKRIFSKVKKIVFGNKKIDDELVNAYLSGDHKKAMLLFESKSPSIKRKYIVSAAAKQFMVWGIIVGIAYGGYEAYEQLNKSPKK